MTKHITEATGKENLRLSATGSNTAGASPAFAVYRGSKTHHRTGSSYTTRTSRGTCAAPFHSGPLFVTTLVPSLVKLLPLSLKQGSPAKRDENSLMKGRSAGLMPGGNIVSNSKSGRGSPTAPLSCGWKKRRKLQDSTRPARKANDSAPRGAQAGHTAYLALPGGMCSLPEIGRLGQEQQIVSIWEASAAKEMKW